MNPIPSPGGSTPAGENNLVVARYRTGEVIKGSTGDFFPERPLFHVLPKGGGAAVPVKTAELKGVFFVRSLVGDRNHQKGRSFPKTDPASQTGRHIAVLFEDGEVLVGYSQTYGPEKTGFFVYPADPGSNNTRVYVLRAATKVIKLGAAADEYARIAPPPRARRPAA